MCLSVDSVLQVISALLTGQTVIFVSSLYPMLTYVIQSFLTYISPFVWRHGLVPILPQPLLEYLDAPVATILGIHSSLTIEPEFQRVSVLDGPVGRVEGGPVGKVEGGPVGRLEGGPVGRVEEGGPVGRDHWGG